VKANQGLTVERMVELGRISRSSFYRFDEDRPARRDGDMELRDAIHRIALEWPSYGRPRITKELRRQGFVVRRASTSPRLIASYRSHPTGVIMASVRAIRVSDSRNRRTGAGAHSMMDDAAGIAEDLQAIGAIGERREAPGSIAEHVRGVMVQEFHTRHFLMGMRVQPPCCRLACPVLSSCVTR